MDIIYINPTFLRAAILGGAIMGVGFVLGGYCPGTSLVGAAVGRIDAMVFVLGGLAGMFVFGEAYPSVLSILTAGSYGDLTVSQALGISQGQFALGLIVVAVAAFAATTWIERRVNPESGARAFPRRAHHYAAAAVLLLGVVLAAMPDRKPSLLAKAASPDFQRAHPVERMSADELAFHLIDGGRTVVPVDVRDEAEFAKMTLPGAVNVQPAAMLGKQWRSLLSEEHKKKVFFAHDEQTAVRAATLAAMLGYRNVAALEGGLEAFSRTILQPAAAGADEAVTRFRRRASVEIAEMIKQRGGVKPVRKVRRIQGGCGS